MIIIIILILIIIIIIISQTFKYLGSLLTNENYIHEGLKSIFKIGNPYYYLVQTPLFSGLLSKNLIIRIYKKIMSVVLVYGYLKGRIWSKGI